MFVSMPNIHVAYILSITSIFQSATEAYGLHWQECKGCSMFLFGSSPIILAELGHGMSDMWMLSQQAVVYYLRMFVYTVRGDTNLSTDMQMQMFFQKTQHGYYIEYYYVYVLPIDVNLVHLKWRGIGSDIIMVTTLFLSGNSLTFGVFW